MNMKCRVMRSWLGSLCASLLVFGVGFVLCSVACAQDFPYSVPEAPEIGLNDSSEDSGAEKKSYKKPRSSRKRNSSRRGSRSQSSSNGPQYVNRQPNQGNPAYSNQPGTYPPPQGYAPPGIPPASSGVAARPPAQAQPDCSQYPIRIANARTDGEMRQLAKMYLGCLVQRGWPMDRAKQTVISCIESTYRVMNR